MKSKGWTAEGLELDEEMAVALQQMVTRFSTHHWENLKQKTSILNHFV